MEQIKLHFEATFFEISNLNVKWVSCPSCTLEAKLFVTAKFGPVWRYFSLAALLVSNAREDGQVKWLVAILFSLT